MEYTRMSTKDMLQYCDEALAWEEFGPVDIFFFESVKRLLLGQCSAVETGTAEKQTAMHALRFLTLRAHKNLPRRRITAGK
ncbi:MAG: hypothetical protein IKI37_01430 [Oscillospiraceae bacterium]|nr:hypothetical protein [Oscillospiraceae bacterium]